MRSVGLRLVPALGVAAIAVLAQRMELGSSVDRRIQDILLRIPSLEAPAHPAGIPDAVVVAIDPRSLRAFDDWPWPRSRHARLIERLDAAGARAIAFDIDFSSASTPEQDATLAGALRQSGRVVLATFSQTQRMSGDVELEVISRPVPELEQAAAGLGSVLVSVDGDGVVRRMSAASSIAGRSVPSLARAALGVATREPVSTGSARRAPPIEPMASEAADEPSPIDYRRRHPPIPTLSHLDVLEGRFERSDIEGRTVFVGVTAAEFQDLWATPSDPAMPGVTIQAIAYRSAAAERAGDPVLRHASRSLSLAILLGITLALIPLAGRSVWLRVGASLLCVAGILAFAWLMLWSRGVVVPIAMPVLVVGLQYVLGIEGLRQRIQRNMAAHESSLAALARLGDVTGETAGSSSGSSSSSDSEGLDLALGLLGDVTEARGVCLLRADEAGRLSGERIEWRPRSDSVEPLEIDARSASEALDRGRVLECATERGPVSYTPLRSRGENVGLLATFGHPGRPIDALQRRTIATVGAQIALTAQNIRLIERLRATFESSIAAVASAVEARDGYTDQHCRRLAAFSSLMGTRLGLDEDELRAMELGALLHDVGKIGIPDAVLNKAGRLSGDERRIMQRHPEIGAGIVEQVVGLEPATLHCIVHHHERWDGSGYPHGLEGEAIPLVARIVSIVDVWDALSTSRPYKPAFSQEEVRELLQKGRGSQFDPRLVDLFFVVLDEQGEEMLELIAGWGRREASV